MIEFDKIPIYERSRLIETAIDRNEFLMYYQPMLCLRDRRIKVMEALARWRRPGNETIIEAGVFIPEAERTKTIVHLGNWALRTVLSQAREWRRNNKQHVRFSVNASMHQIVFNGFLDNLGDLLKYYEVMPDQVEVEITETVKPYDIAIVRSLIQNIVDLGVHVSLDDFGVAYSGFEYLQEIPAHSVKIDARFVTNIENEPRRVRYLSNLIEFLQKCDREVVAEGVETREQLRILREIGCDRVQGYFIARPMPVHHVEQYIDQRHHEAHHIRQALAIPA